MTAPFSRGHKLPFIYFSPGTWDTQSPLCSLPVTTIIVLHWDWEHKPSSASCSSIRSSETQDQSTIFCWCTLYREGGEHTYNTEPVTLVEIKNSLRDILNQDQDPDRSLTISLCHKRIYKQKTFIEPPRKSNRENTKSTKQRVVRKDKHKLRKK